MTRTAVAVRPEGVVTGQDAIDRRLGVGFRARAGLDQREAGRGMRCEDVAETVALAGQPSVDPCGQVGAGEPCGRPQGEGRGVQRYFFDDSK